MALLPLPVVPSAKDGLHCGYAGLGTARHGTASRPVRQGRAPLRLFGWKTITDEATESSRPPRTGSIAATPPRPASSAPLSSSRPPRTGSIAAWTHSTVPGRLMPVVPSAKDGLHCGHVLLQGPPGCGKVVPSAKDGLHCGAADPRPRLPGLDDVVPSAKDGLHCGKSTVASPGFPTVTSSRPPRTGSIAARRRGR